MPLWAMWTHIRSRNRPVRGHTRRFFPQTFVKRTSCPLGRPDSAPCSCSRRDASGGVKTSNARRQEVQYHPQRFVEKVCVCDPAQADSVTECGSTWPKMAFVSHPRAVVTNRGWDTNDFLPCGKVRPTCGASAGPTCGASAGRQKPHTLTWFCGGSCGLQFVSRPTAYQHMESPHEQTARQCKTANQCFVYKLMMANESSKLSF